MTLPNRVSMRRQTGNSHQRLGRVFLRGLKEPGALHLLPTFAFYSP
jgi:hypothetical protein